MRIPVPDRSGGSSKTAPDEIPFRMADKCKDQLIWQYVRPAHVSWYRVVCAQQVHDCRTNPTTGLDISCQYYASCAVYMDASAIQFERYAWYRIFPVACICSGNRHCRLNQALYPISKRIIPMIPVELLLLYGMLTEVISRFCKKHYVCSIHKAIRQKKINNCRNGFCG